MTTSQNFDSQGVREFFAGKSVFVTGGTGFIGYVLVEKLLRSCPGISRIYLLVRSVDDKTKERKMEKMFSSPVFERLRVESPNVLEKVRAIEGDLTLPELGLSISDEELLKTEVNIVYHSGATLKFDDPLKTAVRVNIEGTQEVVKLCKRMKNLNVLVHVSSILSNCPRTKIEENIYPAPIKADDIISLTNFSNENLINEISDKIIGKYPNTYTFTKGIIEEWLNENKDDLPLVIVRPSIVLSCIDEPVKGWLKNFAGPTGLAAAASKGLFRCIPLGKGVKSDVVPVDMCVNLMIAAAWHMGIKKNTTLEIYNLCSGVQNPITWHELTELTIESSTKYPPNQIFWYPGKIVTSSAVLQKCNEFLFHWLPAIIIDLILLILWKSPRVVNIQKKLSKAVQSLTYFVQNNWEFDDKNVRNLNMMLSDSERKEFNFDVTKINWMEYLDDYSLGIRRYLFKEDDRSLPKARANISIFYWMDQALKISLVVIFFLFVMV